MCNIHRLQVDVLLERFIAGWLARILNCQVRLITRRLETAWSEHTTFDTHSSRLYLLCRVRQTGAATPHLHNHSRTLDLQHSLWRRQATFTNRRTAFIGDTRHTRKHITHNWKPQAAVRASIETLHVHTQLDSWSTHVTSPQGGTHAYESLTMWRERSYCVLPSSLFVDTFSVWKLALCWEIYGTWWYPEPLGAICV